MANDAGAGGTAQDTGGQQAGAQETPAAGAQQQQQQQQQQQTAQTPAAGDTPAGAQPDAWKQGIPSHMLKDTPEATLSEVFKGYKGFLEKQATQGAVGKSPDDYAFQFADELKPYFPNGDDPALKAFQSVAHKLGLPVKTANTIINEVFAPLAKEGKLPAPFNPKTELDGIAKLLGKSGADAMPAVEQATTELQAWATNMGQQLKLSEGAQIELESLLLTSNGFEVVRALQGAASGGDFKLGGMTAAPLSKEEVFALFRDPRADPQSSKFDQKFLEKAEAEREALRQRLQRAG